MVVSIINDSIVYLDNKKPDIKDNDYDAPVYTIELNGSEYEIALGKARYEYVDQNIVYFPLYLVKDSEISCKIGVYEIEADKLESKLDDDLDLDLDKVDKPPLLYKFFNDETLSCQIVDTIPQYNEKKKLEDIEESDKQESVKDVTGEEESGEEESDEEESDEEESDEEESDEEESDEEESDEDSNLTINSTIWIQNYMNSDKYNIVKNPGGGDCLFYSIIDGLKTIGKNYSVAELRQILSDNVDPDKYTIWKTLYDETKQNYDETLIKAKALNAMNKNYRDTLSIIDNKKEKSEIIKSAKQNIDELKSLKEELEFGKQFLREFNFMKNVKNIEDLKKVIKTSTFWGESWSISTLEIILKIKLILLSKEAYQDGDNDNVLQCGQSSQEKYNPLHYIMLSYSGNHYELISYDKKGAFTFTEIPKSVKNLILEKCMEGSEGAYNSIEEFKNLLKNPQISSDKADSDKADSDKADSDKADSDKADSDKADSDKTQLYNDSIVFQYYINSATKPYPGKGSGEKIESKYEKEYYPLSKIPEWRRKLSNLWESNIKLDGYTWLTVEHYYQANKYKNNNPDYYYQFTIESNSDLSKQPKLLNKVKKIKIDSNFESIKNDVMQKGQTAKYEQNKELMDMLQKTKDAKLVHYVKGSLPEVQIITMNIRKKNITN